MNCIKREITPIPAKASIKAPPGREKRLSEAQHVEDDALGQTREGENSNQKSSDVEKGLTVKKSKSNLIKSMSGQK